MSEILVNLLLESRLVTGLDLFVAIGWAKLADDYGTCWAAKPNVAAVIGMSEDFVKERTPNLIASGILVKTGEQKRHANGAATPVLLINVEKLTDALTTPRGINPPVVLPPQGSEPPKDVSTSVSGSRFGFED